MFGYGRLCRQEKNSTGGAVVGASADLERRVRACAAAGLVRKYIMHIHAHTCRLKGVLGGWALSVILAVLMG
jgi:hypothetical protein